MSLLNCNFRPGNSAAVHNTGRPEVEGTAEESSEREANGVTSSIYEFDVVGRQPAYDSRYPNEAVVGLQGEEGTGTLGYCSLVAGRIEVLLTGHGSMDY